jgi:tetratricopeptide (TPR) repeat protein
VEIDPSWGLLEHVDATHIRFDRETFVYYAMLNQLELEILEARSHVTEAQRDPRTLLAALNEDADKSPGEDAFDFEMTLARVFTGAERAALTDKQKKDLRRAFDKAVGSQLDEDNYLGAHVLRSETQGAESRVLALLGGDLVNITLAAREGVWRIVEIEDMDGLVPLFADLLREVTQPNTSRRRVWDFETPEKSLAYLEDLLKASGETPQLLLLKAFSLRNQRDALKNSEESADQEKYKKLDAKAAFKLLQEITRRWPDFAPAHHWLSHEYFDEDKNAEAGLASLRRYNQLEPRDPRGCEELAEELEKLARWPEAEAAYREAIARDPGNSTRHVSLAVFHFRREQLPQAKVALTDAFKLEKEAGEVFYTFDDKLADKIEKLSFAEEQRREQFLLLFPQELARSKTGLTSLAEAQNAQNRYTDAAKTMQRVLALGADAYDYITLARLSREAKRYAEALAAADQALKLNAENVSAHYARALALAQLGRKKEAVAALQKVLEKSDYYAGQLAEEEELKPLAEMPEFKALLKKAKDEAEKKDLPKP